jgi:hypothetical protein
MNRKIILQITLIVGITTITGCNVNHIHSDSDHVTEERDYYCRNLVQGYEKTNLCTDKKKGKLLAEQNKKIIESKYLSEMEYSNWKRPKLGLALSGGGTRSASFSIGVMKALKESGILDKVQIISSVSGGSYASYWYLSKLFYQFKSEEDIPYDLFKTQFDSKSNNLDFADEYRFQYELENSSDILSFSKKPGIWSDIRNGGQLFFNVSSQVLSIPFHWIINGVFDGEVDMSPDRIAYKNGLERTYGYVPLNASLVNFENDKAWLGIIPRVSAEQLSFTELRTQFWTAKRHKNSDIKPPLFVINATGRYGRVLSGTSHDTYRNLEKEVFEFTPWHCGSLLFGYNNTKVCGDISWSEAVAMSGAALDGQQSELDDNGHRLITEFWDLLLAGFLNVANLDLGYHIDNYNNGSGHIWFHKFLPFPLFAVDDAISSSSDLEKDGSSSIYLNDGGASENLGLFSLIQRGVENIIVVDAEHDPNSSFQAAKFVKNTLADYGLIFTLDQEKAINVYDASPEKAVIKGKITGWVDAEGKQKDIELIYIKLAVNKYSTDYPYTVKSFMDSDKKFPHNSTVDIFYDKKQYEAYRDLGYTLGKEVVYVKDKLNINMCQASVSHLKNVQKIVTKIFESHGDFYGCN